jgi:leucyl/phenylalanyl-tRNA--protein transferase
MDNLQNCARMKKASGYHYSEAFNQLNGRGERIRTFDPLVPNQMRYQAALRPDNWYSNRSPCLSRLRQGLFFTDPHQSTDAMPQQPALAWLEPGELFPDVTQAWPAGSEAPGLLAAGGSLDVVSLLRAYSNGIFPWYSQGQPILWWSTDPRMVLQISQFKLHRSLKKAIQRFLADDRCEIRMDSAFDAVIENCAGTQRNGQNGTWILPEMAHAYQALHRAGHAHSVETWVDGELVGGLYCVAVGKAVFGESMFAHRTDASKLALAALVGFCRSEGVALVDCQQNTPHLASMGAGEIPRDRFLERVHEAITLPPLTWHFDPLYWRHILDT